MGHILFFSALLLVSFQAKGCHSQVCGRAPLNPRIVGGAEASPGSWPWQAFLQLEDPDGNVSICGGSLINHQWILTAAHCLNDSVEELTDVFLGAHNLSDLGPQEVYRDVSRWEIHELYNCTGHAEYDIALLKMASPVSYDDYIQPVCLAQKGSTFYTGVKAWVAGWGKLEEDGNYTSDVLQEVSVPIVGHNQCKCMHNITVPDKTICAGYAEGGKDACRGDSGGALVVKKDTVWVEAGIVSFGDGCARPNLPGVYTEVSEFQDWIEGIVGKEDPPGFVKFTSTGEDTDKNYNCTDRPTVPPCVVTTVSPTAAVGTATTTTTTTIICLCFLTFNLW